MSPSLLRRPILALVMILLSSLAAARALQDIASEETGQDARARPESVLELAQQLCRNAGPAHAAGGAPDLCQVAFGAP